MQALLQVFAADERLKRIAPLLQGGREQPAHIHLSGLTGSAPAITAAALASLHRGTILFIFPGKEEAAYFQNDLSHFTGKREVLFLTDSFRRSGKFEELSNSQVQLRTEVMNRIINSPAKNELIVTYPEALMEKVVNRQALRQSTLHIRLQEKLDETFLTDLLGTYGFERVDFVYEPGQFSIRGGILDIFSFGNELPYRVELSGEEVESIRLFDPLTQLSNRRIAQVTIVPNTQTRFSSAEKVALFDILPEETVLWFDNRELIRERVASIFTKAEEVFKALQKLAVTEEAFQVVPQEFFAHPSFLDAVQPVAEDSHSFRFPVIETARKARHATEVISFGMEPPPGISKNFPLLIAHWKKLQKEGFTILLFSDNVNQFKRLQAIFDDVKADIVYHPLPFAIREGFVDRQHQLACFTDHQIFDRYHHYHLRQGFTGSKAQAIKMLRELHPGDYVTHLDHGVGIFSGLEKIEVNGQQQETVRLVYRDKDLLYVSIQSLHKISKYVGKEGTPPRINKLGTDTWEQVKRKVKARVKDISKELIALYARRKATKGFAFSPDSYLQTELEASFMYEDTPDQLKCTNDLKQDMEKGYPMDRLICGDVGFGKTEVAVRAAFKAVGDGKQVAVLVPTTILALQHFKTFSDRLKDFPCSIDYLNRFKSAKQQKDTLEKLQQGRLDILIGTSSLISERVKFKDLGLLIIDEEQKFGVAAKEKLRQLRAHVDTLTLTATPIPRTLQFSLMGARDLSIIHTPPPNRQPIETEVLVFDPDRIREAIEFEVNRGGQVFFIHNRVKDIGEVAAMVRKLCPRAEITIAHGQLEGHVLEEKMIEFIERRSDVLVCTNIVESGLDIPNANTIIINDAHIFGLSDLHQLRGRVGRSNKKAFCYLVTPPFSTLTQEARKRLQTIEEFGDLGSGFQIAMRDMDIRGAGNILGGEQSGFITDIGYETYHKILDETIRELKHSEFRDLFADGKPEERSFARECVIDTDTEMLIPDHYVSNIQERLNLYTELDNLGGDQALSAFETRLRDRFGPLPIEVRELFDGVMLRKLAKQLGFERLQIRRGLMKCYTLEDPESPYYDSAVFARLLGFIVAHPGRCSMRQLDQCMLIQVKEVHSMHEARELLQQVTPEVATLS